MIKCNKILRYYHAPVVQIIGRKLTKNRLHLNIVFVIQPVLLAKLHQ
jgi:hypothetical protein